jgi:hypothetical protein
METSELIRLLASFTSGELGISKFQEAIDERLFDLRMSPSMSPEKELLSKMQLYLHEIDEGLRDEFEIYTLARSILDECLTLLRKKETQHYPPTPPASRLDTSVPEPSYEKMPAIV